MPHFWKIKICVHFDLHEPPTCMNPAPGSSSCPLSGGAEPNNQLTFRTIFIILNEKLLAEKPLGINPIPDYLRRYQTCISQDHKFKISPSTLRKHTKRPQTFNNNSRQTRAQSTPQNPAPRSCSPYASPTLSHCIVDPL